MAIFLHPKMQQSQKVAISPNDAFLLINHGPVVLVTTKNNIITIAWASPLSGNPPLVGISVGKRRYSHELIKQEKEFAINLPNYELLDKVAFCGSTSGRNIDKFKEAKLTKLKAKVINAALIKECSAHIECKLEKEIEVGDHTLFVGRIVAATANKDIFTNYLDVRKVNTLHHLGGDKYTLAKEVVSVR